MNRLSVAALALLASPAAALAQGAPPDTSFRVTFGGFVDTYYAYDFGTPPTLDRSFSGGATFTTQPARHNEFNVNLAYVEALVSAHRIRGRLALQAGTSVQSNYGAEPTVGVISGPSLSRLLQEAYAGYQVTPSTLGGRRHLLLAHGPGELGVEGQPDLHAVADGGVLAVLLQWRACHLGGDAEAHGAPATS